VFDGPHRGDSAPGSMGFAVQPSGGTGKLEDVLQIPAAQNAVGESRVKEVSGAGRVSHRHAVGGSISEALAVPGQGSPLAHGGAHNDRSVFQPDCGERKQRVVGAPEWFENTKRQHRVVHLR